MGYRSEVGLVLTRAGVDVLNKKLADPEVSEETRKEVEACWPMPRIIIPTLKAARKSGFGIG